MKADLFRRVLDELEDDGGDGGGEKTGKGRGRVGLRVDPGAKEDVEVLCGILKEHSAR